MLLSHGNNRSAISSLNHDEAWKALERRAGFHKQTPNIEQHQRAVCTIGDSPQNHQAEYPTIPRTLVNDARYRSRGTHALRLAPFGDDIAVANDQPELNETTQHFAVFKTQRRGSNPARAPHPRFQSSRKLVTLKARERTDLK